MDHLADAEASASSRDAAACFFRTSEEGFALARDGRVISVNPACCTIAGSRPLVEVGRSIETLFLAHELNQPLAGRYQRIWIGARSAPARLTLQAADIAT